MYHALYRKYRPMDFDSVVGQDAIIKTLKNSIINNTFTHAYMFFGPRGTGKTTVSKIFARNINCLSPKNGIACGKCENCKISFSKECVDIIEIDAASNNGVDEIRELRSKISLVPSELKYKVYIIDEVHMLSIGAFNALLKTLEEPPEHAIFILATTDPQKVPETIISRCQCYSFKRISIKSIYDRLKYVCDSEKIDISDDVLEAISKLSDGGLRDALGLLDKLVSYSSDKITIDDFNDINGIVSNDVIKSLILDVYNNNISEFLSKLNEFNDCGKNLVQIINQIIYVSRDSIVDYYIYNSDLFCDINFLQEFVIYLNERLYDIKKSDNTIIYIEMSILKFLNNYNSIVNTNSINNYQNLNNNDLSDNVVINNNYVEENSSSNIKESNLKINNDVVDNNNFSIDTTEPSINNDVVDSKSLLEDNVSDYEENKRIVNIDEIMNIRVHNILAQADKSLLKNEISNLDIFNDYTFDQDFGYIVCSILDSKIRAVSSSGIIISFESDATVKQNLSNILKINEVYNNISNSNKKIAIVSDDYWEELKKEYISNLKNNIKYQIKEEPEVLFEDLHKDDIITSSAVNLFGDIVEID